VKESYRVTREKKTIGIMVGIYCRHHHNSPKGELCEECTDLVQYAAARIDGCKFLPDKPTCRNCPVHCYKKSSKEQIKKVMRYSGPRMMFYYPILTIIHYIDGYRDKERVSIKSLTKIR